MLVRKYEILFLVILKILEHFENSRKKLSQRFLEIALVEYVKIIYIKQVLQIFMKVNPIFPGVFLSDHVPGGHIVPPLCVNPDRKKVLHEIWHSHTLQCYKKMIEKNFQNCSYRDDDVTNYVNFFEKLRKKWLKYVFFLKLTL